MKSRFSMWIMVCLVAASAFAADPAPAAAPADKAALIKELRRTEARVQIKPRGSR